MNRKNTARYHGAIAEIVLVTLTTILTLLAVGAVYVMLPDLGPVHQAEAEREEAKRQEAYEEKKRQEAIKRAEEEAKRAEEEAFLRTPEGILSDGIVTFNEIYVYAGEQYVGTVNEDAVPDYGSESLLNPMYYRQVVDQNYRSSRYKFAFADNLYNKLEVVDIGQGFRQESLYEYSSTVDGSYLRVGYDMISSKESEKYLKLMYNTLTEGLTDITEEMYEVDAENYYAAALYNAKDGNMDVTILIEVSNVNVCHLVLKYPEAVSEEDRLHKTYYRDCILNYCGFYEYGEGAAYVYEEYINRQ